MIHAVVLAAGAGRRFGGPAGAKLWAPWWGKPVIEHVFDTLTVLEREGTIEGTLVVHSPTGDRVKESAVTHGFDAVLASRAEQGLSESLKAAFTTLEAATTRRTTAALICLADQPALSLGTVRALVAAAGGNPAVLLRPRYAEAPDAPGHPTVLGRTHWPLSQETTGDRGLDPILTIHHLAWTEIPTPGSNPDIDTPADL